MTLKAATLLAWLAVLPASAPALTVVIDPGHGGIKDGAISPDGVMEKNVTLAVALKLRRLLAAHKDVRVILTRHRDKNVDLRERTEIANRAKADLLVSIHCNSMPTDQARRSTSGIETYFLSADASDPEADALANRENADVGTNSESLGGQDPVNQILRDLSLNVAHADSQSLAEDVHLSMVHELHAKDRGVRQAPFIVLLGAEMPAILVEVGFISHPVEGRLLATQTYESRVAAALRDAILKFQRTVLAKRAARPRAVTEVTRRKQTVSSRSTLH